MIPVGLQNILDRVAYNATYNASVSSAETNGLQYPDYIPPVPQTTINTATTTRPSRQTVNSVATSSAERQMMVAADRAVIPLIYGRQRVGAKIAVVKLHEDYLYILAVFALGECNAIESILFEGEENTDYIVSEYLGTTTQTADTTLAGIISGYTDDLVINYNGQDIGTCYAVLKVPVDDFPNKIEAIIQGQSNIYDPRTTTSYYSTNPALCLADFKSNDIYGQGLTPDWDSIELVADDNDELVGVDKRREINIAIDKMSDISNHIEAMRVYAGCFILQEDTFKLVSDRPATVTRNLTNTDIVDGSLIIKKSGTAKLPTVMTVVYTDITAEPWKDAEAKTELLGLTERRESIIKLQGITTYNQAMREAIERLNALNLSDLVVEFTSFDESLADQVGDVITITHHKGLTSKKLRILSVNQESIGRYKILSAEYDEAVYSDNLETEPTYPDTTLPSPNAPIPVTNLQASEELFQQGTGVYASRIRITWDAPDYPYIQYYRVIVKVGVDVVFEVNAISPEAATGAVLDTQSDIDGIIELKQHDIEVSVYSGLSYSSIETTSITPQGKYLPPGDVSTLSGFEAGGTVYLQWPQAIDIDIWKYEVRYGLVGTTWETADLLDRTDSLRLTTEEIAAGTWKFFVKALDSVSNYSENAATKTLSVTIDSDAFLVEERQFSNPSLTDMHEYTPQRGVDPIYAVSESTQSWATLFPNAMSTYVNSVNSYQASVTSEYLSETWDAGLELSGDWAAEIDTSTISGTVVTQMELSTDASSWDAYTNLSAKATARYARVRVESNTGLFIINWPSVLIRINAIPKAENGETISLSTGGKEIQLVNDYTKVKAITVTPVGTTSLTSVINDIDLTSTPNTFDVYIFNSSGTRVANNFIWKFEGV